MALEPLDAHRAPPSPAYIHDNGCIPGLTVFADYLVRRHELGQIAHAIEPSSENDGACEVHIGNIDVEQKRADYPQSLQRSMQTVGVPSLVRSTDKSDCIRGGMHADRQAEDMFDPLGSPEQFSTSPVQTILVSQRMPSSSMQDCQTWNDDKDVVPTMACSTDKSHCIRGGMHAYWQAEAMLELMIGRPQQFSTPPVPTKLLSQRVASKNMEDYKTLTDDKDGVPTEVRNTDKSHCTRGGVHADRQAEHIFDRNFNFMTGSAEQFSTSPVPAILLSQRVTSNNMDDYKTLTDGKDLTIHQSHNNHQHHEEAPWQEITTIMIRNLPRGLTQKALLQELNRSGFQSQYDLVYLPHNFVNNSNLSFAFVNFTTASAAQLFIDQWHGSNRHFTQNVYAAGLNLRPAMLQGVDSNLKQWLGARGKRIRNPNFRPFVAEHLAKKAQAIVECSNRNKRDKNE